MREVVRYMVSHHGYSKRRACRTTRLSRRHIEYKSRKGPHTALRMRMKEIAQTRLRFGYRRLLVMLKREGWVIGKKLVYRLYREEGLLLHKRGRKGRKMTVNRGPRYQAQQVNEVWSELYPV